MNCYLTCVFLVIAAFCTVETAKAQTAPPGTTKYWIFFTDRGNENDSYRHAITREALERRARRGSAVPASLDYDVSRGYIAALHQLGVEIVVKSRWMNAASAHLTPEQHSDVAKLAFVERVTPVGRGAQEHSSRSLPTSLGFSGSSLPIRSDLHSPPSGATSGSPPIPKAGPLALDYGPSEIQLALVNAIPPLEAGISGTGVRLGFLDASYLGLEHPALQHLHLARRVEIKNFTGRDDGSSHGLSVVSVAAAYAPGELIGPAYGAYILAATTEYVPTETNAEEDYFVAGLEWLEAAGADVVSASIGYTTFDLGQHSYTPNDLDGDSGITSRAADRAVSLGITFVSAAGNEGCSSPSNCWYYVGTPADGDSVIAVGGVNKDSTRYFGSSYGPTVDGRIKPDVAAMGTGVYLAVPGGEYRRSSGTSFAAPMVAGIVAQMLQANPTLSPVEVRDILRQTADQAKEPDNSLGWGIVNASAAIQAAVSLSTEELPESKALSAHAYPNPATDFLFIHINARSIHSPRVQLYDVLGRSVDAESAEVRYQSRNLISFDASSLAAGVYVYFIEADEMRTTGTFVVVR